MNKWSLIRDYFNTKTSNKIFTRAEVMMFLKQSFRQNKFDFDEGYVDVCRNCLVRAGYFKIEEPGVYRKLKKLPADLTISKLEKEAKSIGKISGIESLLDRKTGRIYRR